MLRASVFGGWKSEVAVRHLPWQGMSTTFGRKVCSREKGAENLLAWAPTRVDQKRELTLACQPNATVIKNKPLEIKYLEIISILTHFQYERINSYN
jgi:hypothetical protein